MSVNFPKLITIVQASNGKNEFRYMKANPTASKPCLACHSTKIKQQVTAKLNETYPDDKAFGYNARDIRGAFTIRQPMQKNGPAMCDDEVWF